MRDRLSADSLRSRRDSSDGRAVSREPSTAHKPVESQTRAERESGPAKIAWRRFRPDDISAVRELHKLALHAAGAFADPVQAQLWDRDLDDIAGVYLMPGGEFLVGVLGNRIMAMGALRLLGGGSGEIKRLRVDPHHQRRGLGRQLLTQLETYAAVAGVTTLSLDTSTVQTAALHLFASAGYIETRREHCGGLEMIFMEKNARRRDGCRGSLADRGLPVPPLARRGAPHSRSWDRQATSTPPGARRPGRPWQSRRTGLHGTTFDEVRNAQTALLNTIKTLTGILCNPSATAEEREAAQTAFGDASRMLDKSEEYLPR